MRWHARGLFGAVVVGVCALCAMAGDPLFEDVSPARKVDARRPVAMQFISKNYARVRVRDVELWFGQSPDDRHIATAVKTREGKCLVVFDDAPGPTFDSVGGIAFSADSSRWCYIATVGGEKLMVCDGKRVPGVIRAKFSPVGSRLATVVVDGEKQRVILDSKADPPYARIDDLVFSPDGKRLAYVASNDDQSWFTVLHGEGAGEKYSYAPSSLRFSPDGRRVAYAASSGSRRFAVIDGTAQETPTYAGGFVFSPDSRRVAYVLEWVHNRPVASTRPATQPAREACYVVDGKPHCRYSYVDRGIFSPDGQRFAYQAIASADQSHIVIDGQNVPAEGHTGTVTQQMAFSPDSRHFAFVAKQLDGRERVYIDGAGNKTYDRIEGLAYDAGGRLLYMASPDRGTCFVVVDGIEGSKYTALPFFDRALTPDRQHWACAGHDAEEAVALVDGVEVKRFGKGTWCRVVLAPDKKPLIVSWRGNRPADSHWRVTYNGVESADFPGYPQLHAGLYHDRPGVESPRRLFFTVETAAGYERATIDLDAFVAGEPKTAGDPLFEDDPPGQGEMRRGK